MDTNPRHDSRSYEPEPAQFDCRGYRPGAFRNHAAPLVLIAGGLLAVAVLFMIF